MWFNRDESKEVMIKVTKVVEVTGICLHLSKEQSLALLRVIQASKRAAYQWSRCDKELFETADCFTMVIEEALKEIPCSK